MHAPQSLSLLQFPPVWGPDVQVPLPGQLLWLVQFKPWFDPLSHALQSVSTVHAFPALIPPTQAPQSESWVHAFPG